VLRRTAGEAADVLGRLVDEHDFVLYEYFLTDLVAHRGDSSAKLEQARRAEALVDAALARIDRGRHDVIVTSDHGNLEESHHGRHTTNPVPFLVWGPRAARLAGTVREMTDVTPALVRLTGGGEPGPL
jgi:2,3-bisphosphoglycerate-independent phosphoglycerate mutase